MPGLNLTLTFPRKQQIRVVSWYGERGINFFQQNNFRGRKMLTNRYYLNTELLSPGQQFPHGLQCVGVG